MSYKRITHRERFIAEKFPAFVFRAIAYMNRQARRSATGYTRPTGRFHNTKTHNPRITPGRIAILREFLTY